MKKFLVILMIAFLSLSFIVGSNSTIYVTSMGNVKNSDIVIVQKELSSFYDCKVIILPNIFVIIFNLFSLNKKKNLRENSLRFLNYWKSIKYQI